MSKMGHSVILCGFLVAASDALMIGSAVSVALGVRRQNPVRANEVAPPTGFEWGIDTSSLPDATIECLVEGRPSGRQHICVVLLNIS